MPADKTAAGWPGGTVSAPPLPVPEACRRAYDSYLADLDRAGLAAATRARRACYVRRFLRCLADDGGDAGTVLAQQQAWDRAVARFVTDLAASLAPPTIHAYQQALADCGRRLGLAQPAKPAISPRLCPVYDCYATALAQSPYSAATIRSNLATVRSLLRWLTQTGYAGDLQRDWGMAVERYLQHLTARGNAGGTAARRRWALNDCATRLRLPSTWATAGHPGGGATAADPARGARSTDSARDRPGATR